MSASANPDRRDAPGGGLLLALRLALRELRGGLKGFRIFLACLILGVAAIAGVGSVSEAMLAGIRADGRTLLGGDLDVRIYHRRASEAEQAWLAARGTLSRVVKGDAGILQGLEEGQNLAARHAESMAAAAGVERAREDRRRRAHAVGLRSRFK